MLHIRMLTAPEALPCLASLADLLLDCVEGGASVGFMAPLPRAAAEAFFHQILQDVEHGRRLLLAAFLDSKLVGSVQIHLATPPNQPHRADIAKLLVSRAARRQGVAELLMSHAEQASSAAGKTLLVLDTVTGGAAERLYLRLGWVRVGVIPDYALFPNGTPCATTVFYKQLPPLDGSA